MNFQSLDGIMAGPDSGLVIVLTIIAFLVRVNNYSCQSYVDDHSPLSSHTKNDQERRIVLELFFLPWKKSKCALSLLVHILGVIFILSCLPQTPRADLRDADSTPLRGLPVVSRSLHQQHSQEDDHDDDGQRTIMFINVNVDVLLLRRIRPASKWTLGTAFYLWP